MRMGADDAEMTPAQVVEACELLIPLCAGLTERCPDVWSGETVAMLELFRNLARQDLQ